MKKLYAICLIALLPLSAGGCTNETAPPAPELAADGSCIVRYKDGKYDCNIRFISKDIEAITVNAPDSVKGMTFRSGKDGFTLSFSGLVCRSSEILLPEASFPRAAAEAVHEMRKSDVPYEISDDKDGYTFTAKGYTLRTDKNGTIKELML